MMRLLRRVTAALHRWTQPQYETPSLPCYPPIRASNAPPDEPSEGVVKLPPPWPPGTPVVAISDRWYVTDADGDLTLHHLDLVTGWRSYQCEPRRPRRPPDARPVAFDDNWYVTVDDGRLRMYVGEPGGSWQERPLPDGVTWLRFPKPGGDETT